MKLLFLLIAFASNSMAHVDAIIELRGNELFGLPPTYQPATFDVQTLTLRVKNNSVSFPTCFTKLLNWNEQVEIYSSWYHDPKWYGLPAYIGFRSPDLEVGLVLDLETLKPIPLSVGFGKNERELDCIKEFEVLKNET